MISEALSIPKWHQEILNQLDIRLGHSFIADDPDYLLSEENLQKEIFLVYKANLCKSINI